MILQKLDAVSEKIAKNGRFCPLISLKEHITKVKGYTFSILPTYLHVRRVAKIRETEKRRRDSGESVFRKKTIDANIMVVHLLSLYHNCDSTTIRLRYDDTGCVKMQDMKMQDVKMKDQVARQENAGHENARHDAISKQQ